MDYQLTGSAATKGVEGEKVASGDRHSPLLHDWCRFCGSTFITSEIAVVMDMICHDCFKHLVETSSDAFIKNFQFPEFEKISQTIGQTTETFQKMADHLDDLARRTMPAPDSPLSPYLASQGLTLDELETAIQTLLEDSPSDTVPPALTGSLRGPSPTAVFYDDLP